MLITGRHRFYSWVVIASTALVLAGCKPSGSGLPKRTKITRIVVIGEGQDEPTWPVIRATAESFARKYSLTVLDARAPLTASPRDQQKLLEAMMKEEVDAVCIHPTDPTAVRGAMDLLGQRGVKVVTIGRDVQPSNREAYCGPSEFELGEYSVRAAVLGLEHRSKTLMLLHAGVEEGNYSKRYYGFKQAVSQTSGLQVLREVDCRGDRLNAVRDVRRESRKFPRVGSWVFLDDWPLRALGRDEQLLPLGVTFVLCNGSPRYFDRLRDGRIQALVAYDFQKSVEDALFAAVRLAEERSGSLTTEFKVPPEIVTAKNLSAYEARWKKWSRGEPTDFKNNP